MIADDEQARAVLLSELPTAQTQIAIAEQELVDQGINQPSLADCLAWTNATRKQRERPAYLWAEMQAIGDPIWKAR